MPHHTTGTVLMVRPANFARASVTVADNHFQDTPDNEHFLPVALAARREFDAFVARLRAAGVQVLVVEDTAVPVKPDAVFPNNWLSTHEDGLLITYPVYHPQRRAERRRDIIDALAGTHRVHRILSLEKWEREGRYLESTGSLILDRSHRIAYACRSQRCSRAALRDWCTALHYRPLLFDALDDGGRPVYHTNVMMSLGTHHAVVCLESVPDPAQRKRLLQSLRDGGREVLPITLSQMAAFAGNMIELTTPEGPLWVMSTSAYTSLREDQIKTLLSPPNTRLLHSDLSNIERFGGGSARCMIAEVFLPAG